MACHCRQERAAMLKCNRSSLMSHFTSVLHQTRICVSIPELASAQESGHLRVDISDDVGDVSWGPNALPKNILWCKIVASFVAFYLLMNIAQIFFAPYRLRHLGAL